MKTSSRYDQVQDAAKAISARWLDVPKSGRNARMRIERPHTDRREVLLKVATSWARAYCLRQRQLWPTGYALVGSDTISFKFGPMSRSVKRIYLNEGRKTVELINVNGLTIVDPKGSIPPEAVAKMTTVYQRMELPPVVVWVTQNRRRAARWSGLAHTYTKPQERLKRHGKYYALMYPAFPISLRVGDDIGPEDDDVYRVWMGSVNGEGTLLALFAHELTHVLSDVRQLHLREAEVSQRAFEMCRMLFAGLYMTDKEDWYALFGSHGCATQEERRAAALRPRDTSGRVDGSNTISMLTRKEHTMRVGTDTTAFTTVRIGKGKDATTIKVYEAAAEEVSGVITDKLGEQPEITTVRVKFNGKGNKPTTLKIAGNQADVTAAVTAALEEAAGKPAAKPAAKPVAKPAPAPAPAVAPKK